MITNRRFGAGPKEQVHYGEGYPKPRKTPWEEIEHSHAINGTGRSASTPALPSAAPAAEARRSEQPSASPVAAPVRSSRSSGRASRDGAASERATSERSRASKA